MARAKRHFIPGQIWHITHRCHKREFLLKFAIDYERLRDLFGTASYDRLRKIHRQWVNEYLDKTEKNREEEWTRSIAVGSQPLVESMKNLLGIRTKRREVIEGAKGYHLWEEAAGYQALFEVKNSEIGLDNATLLDINA